MTLRTNGLDWLAQNAGIGNCFASSGISYKDADGVSHTGGTKDVVNAFLVADMVGKQTAVIIAGTNYNGFKAINDGYDLALDDITEAADREADGGAYPQYCYTPGAVCTPGTKRCRDSKTVEQCRGDGSGWDVIQTCGAGYECKVDACVPVTEPPTTETPPMEVYVGGGTPCPPGSPSVALDTDDGFAYFKATPVPYVGVMDILVHNLNTSCYAYFAWEMRLWDGSGYTECPPEENVELKQISRFLATVSDTKVITISRLNASENKMISGSFEVPTTMVGLKTVCLSLWGNFDKAALIAELAAAGYAEEISWV